MDLSQWNENIRFVNVQMFNTNQFGLIEIKRESTQNK